MSAIKNTIVIYSNYFFFCFLLAHNSFSSFAILIPLVIREPRSVYASLSFYHSFRYCFHYSLMYLLQMLSSPLCHPFQNQFAFVLLKTYSFDTFLYTIYSPAFYGGNDSILLISFKSVLPLLSSLSTAHRIQSQHFTNFSRTLRFVF